MKIKVIRSNNCCIPPCKEKANTWFLDTQEGAWTDEGEYSSFAYCPYHIQLLAKDAFTHKFINKQKLYRFAKEENHKEAEKVLYEI